MYPGARCSKGPRSWRPSCPGCARNVRGRRGKKVKLAFCSQLLCVIPYEVARAGEHFQQQGLDVELIYTRGGNVAMQALVGGAVDYARSTWRSRRSRAARK